MDLANGSSKIIRLWSKRYPVPVRPQWASMDFCIRWQLKTVDRTVAIYRLLVGKGLKSKENKRTNEKVMIGTPWLIATRRGFCSYKCCSDKRCTKPFPSLTHTFVGDGRASIRHGKSEGRQMWVQDRGQYTILLKEGAPPVPSEWWEVVVCKVTIHLLVTQPSLLIKTAPFVERSPKVGSVWCILIPYPCLGLRVFILAI